MRGVLALAAVLLTAVGLAMTVFTLTVSGWTVLAGVGVGLLVWDLWLEERAS